MRLLRDAFLYFLIVFAAALLRRQSIGEFLASYDTPEGIVSLFAYFGFAVMPLTGGRSASGT
jgi:hypothetical protein